jgi:hypothetical protein
VATYRVILTAGPYSWTVTDADPPGYGLADPLVIGWSLPTDAVRPAQPDPVVMQFNVVVPSAAALVLGIGEQVQASVWFASTTLPPTTSTPDVWFRGRITDGSATLTKAGDVLFAFTASDQSIDLTAADIGALDYPPATWTNRLAALTSNALPAIGGSILADPRIGAGVEANLWVDQRDGSPDTVLDAVTELFEWTAFTGTGPNAGVTFFTPIVAAGPGAIPDGTYYPVAFDALPDRFIPSIGAQAPAVFGPIPGAPGKYGVIINANDRAAGVLDACFIEFGVQWTAGKADTVNTAVITWQQAAAADPKVNDRTPQTTRVTELPPAAGRPPVISTRETDILGLTGTPATVTAAQTNANRLGHLMNPPLQQQHGWSPDGFTWLLDADHLGLDDFPVIFPQTFRPMSQTGQNMRAICYVRPVVIMNTPPAWNPMDPVKGRVYGQLGEVRLTIEAGTPRVEFTLTPTLPEVGGPAGSRLSWNQSVGTWNAQVGIWDDLAPGYIGFLWEDPALVGLTWNQLYPADTWIDYQLLRGT